MKTNRFPSETNVTRRGFTAMALLSILLGLFPGSVFPTPPAARAVEPLPGPAPNANLAVVNDDPPVEPAAIVYLPLVIRSGEAGPPRPASPYAAALSRALADCANTALNQVCYAAGTVTLDGGAPLTTPGQILPLDGVSGLTLVSPDAGHWSIALLRLAADALTANLGLTLLAFGNVEIRNLTLFDAAAGNGDAAPALSFTSSPVPGQDPETGALLVYNPNDEEPLSINLNGADLTLASSAVVEAQPENKMTVTMASGSALISTAAGDDALLQAYQLTVPLDGNGTAAGAPTPPTLTGEDLLEPLVPSDKSDEDDLLEPLVPSEVVLQRIYDERLAKFESAYERCVQGDSRQVYRVMYYARVLKPYESVYPPGTMGRIELEVEQCATFELEFNSVITPTSSLAWGSMYIQGQGMIVTYDMDGHLVQPAQMPLTHVRYDVDFALAPCIYLTLADGRVVHSDGYMRINRNRLDISTTLNPVDIWEHMIYTCYEQPIELANPAGWRTLFTELHQSEIVVLGFQFTPDHWKYTGNQILAEAIFTREVMFGDGVATENTWLVLLHKPGG